MRRAVLGSIAFFLLAPGVNAGLVPWLITGWEGSPTGLDPVDLAGATLIVGGAVLALVCFVQFVRDGHGTPAPVAPTDELVVTGVYRWIRNPMYVGVAAAVAGQAIVFRSWPLAVWLTLFLTAVVSFVVAYEQPTLARQFGASYERYRRDVPGWLPRVRL